MKEPIRILHMIASLELGGSQAMVMNIYKKIDRTKIQFDFLIDHSEKKDIRDDIEKLGGKIYEMPTFKGFNYFSIKKAWDLFFKQHREYKVLHTHSRSYASVYIPIAKKNGLTVISHSHSTSNGKGIKSIIKKILQYPIRKQADFFFACSYDAGEWLFGKKVIKDSRFSILKNGIDTNRFIYSPEKREKVRQDNNLDGKFVYINVGRFCDAKNHRFIIELFSSIHSRNANAMLLLIGDGELKSLIEKQVQELGLSNHVIFKGAIKNPEDYLQAADCFLFPSKWEGLGIAAIEAQASGLHCICSTCVPKEVCVTDLCEFIPLNRVQEWIKASEKKIDRYDTSSLIKNSGYDIMSSVAFLENFYLSL